MKHRKEIETTKLIARAFAFYSMRGSRLPEEQAQIEKEARLAAAAVLELQGVQPTQTEINIVLLEL